MNDRIIHGQGQWYVLSFCAARFRSVFKYLDGLDVHWFCPVKPHLHQRAGRGKSYIIKNIPLFPGYLFIRLDFNVLHSTQVTRFTHIRRFVSFGGEPVPVPDDIVRQIQNSERDKPVELPVMKSISHEFAEVLLLEDPLMRNYSLLRAYPNRILFQTMKPQEG